MGLNFAAQEMVSGLPVWLGCTPDNYLALFCFSEEDEGQRFIQAMGISPNSDFDHDNIDEVVGLLLSEAEECGTTHLLTAHIGNDPALAYAQVRLTINAPRCNIEPLGVAHTPQLAIGEQIVGVNLIEEENLIRAQQIPLEETMAWKNEKERNADYTGPWPSVSSDEFEEALKNEFPS